MRSPSIDLSHQLPANRLLVTQVANVSPRRRNRTFGASLLK